MSQNISRAQLAIGGPETQLEDWNLKIDQFASNVDTFTSIVNNGRLNKTLPFTSALQYFFLGVLKLDFDRYYKSCLAVAKLH